MNSEAQKVVDDAAKRQIPAEMLERLSRSEDRLHESRKRLDRANAGSEIGHIADVTTATDQVREAEREVEAAAEAIRDKLPGGAKSGEPSTEKK